MWGKKREKKCFYKHTNIARKKHGKKSSGKSAKTSFFINTQMSRPLNGKKREKKFIPETRISRPKNDGKKSSGKSAKYVFY